VSPRGSVETIWSKGADPGCLVPVLVSDKRPRPASEFPPVGPSKRMEGGRPGLYVGGAISRVRPPALSRRSSQGLQLNIDIVLQRSLGRRQFRNGDEPEEFGSEARAALVPLRPSRLLLQI
jgi:hypothetical protein